jgi:hypothetical protein
MNDMEFYRALTGIFGTGLFLLFSWVAVQVTKTFNKLVDGQQDHENRITILEEHNRGKE